MRPLELDHVVLRVESIDRALAWYTAVLELEPERVDEWRRGEAPFPSVRVNAHTVIDLVEEERTGENVSHICLAYEDVDIEQLASSGRLDVVDGPSPRWGARGTAMAVYARDPDGNVVELRSYSL